MSCFRGVCLAVLAAAAGCKPADEQNQGTGDPSQWTLTATFSRPDLTIQHGNTDTTTIVVTRGGGFTGQVTISTPFVPPGITATIDNIATTGTTTTARLTVMPGTGSDLVYSIPIPVDVAADGADLHTDPPPTVNINVTRKNGFWVTAPATMSVPRGASSGPITVHFTKTGFSSDVTMSLFQNTAPAGITATFTPNPIASDTNTTMVVSVDPSVVEGTYSVGVRANGGGYQGTAPMTVTVTAAPGLTMVPASPTMTVTKGTQGSNVFTLNRTNLPGLITMSSSSTTLPAAVTVSFGPNPAGGPSTTMFVNVPLLSVQSGTYVINVTSGGTGVPVVTVPITLTIP